MSYRNWPRYVPVAEKRKKAETALKKLQKKGQKLSPLSLTSKKIATTFWGKAWCDHLESFSDYENRLPRGRTYVRNGYVVHLGINPGEIEAMVQGSSLYKVKISIKEASKQKWQAIVKACSGKIESAFDLLQGKLSKPVMEVITHKHDGLFPQPKEIELSCSCPDWADMCKHVAAVMYGVGAKLDNEPELLFVLRKVDQADLISEATKIPTATARKSKTAVSDQSLQNIFGIEIEDNAFTRNTNEATEIKHSKSKLKTTLPSKKTRATLTTQPAVGIKKTAKKILKKKKLTANSSKSKMTKSKTVK